ncbi:MAG: alkaline phosphatase [Deltaproteobacteria bacterium]|nr:alkaline phosphatase [Deltaproteobacteria bacterium]
MCKGLGLLLFTGLLLGTSCPAEETCPLVEESTAKYVFLFIGDGMGSPQIHAAEAYLADKKQPDQLAGGIKAKLLSMDYFPVVGLSTTYANDRFITDSAAAGTALACGMKTNVGVISMDPQVSKPYKTLAEAAKEKGMKVGILSSVSIDHATPAVYYSHQPTRNNYREIAMELANSDFDYFAGGGFKKDEGAGAIPAALANGFKYVNDRAGLGGCVPGDRVIATTQTTDGSALPYALDCLEGYYADNISLAEFTAKGIELLDNPDGFFMMVEGGKIDWACHANDARAAIDDTLAFDQAVWEAIRFYMANPDDTLIVITGDHECGGMTIGFAGTNYDTSFADLARQRKSFIMFEVAYFKDYKAARGWSGVADDIDQPLKDHIQYFFGLNWDDLTDYEKAQLEDAFDRSMAGASIVSSQEDYELYGGYEALTVTLTHLLNRKAGIGFTSYAHTGVPVPVYAMGFGEATFGGFYDNTDVARKIAKLMNVGIGDVN